MRTDTRRRWAPRIWLLLFPAFVVLAFFYAVDVWCPAPLPESEAGLLRDTEMCRGDDGSLLIGVAQVMVLWFGGFLWFRWWSRQPPADREWPDPWDDDW